MTTNNNNNNNTTKNQEWGHLPSSTYYWGEVGISLQIANVAARVAAKDPKLHFKIQRNHLMDLIQEHHSKATQAERQANRHRARAERYTKTAQRKERNPHHAPEAADMLVKAEECRHQANECTTLAEQQRYAEAMARNELATLVHMPHEINVNHNEEDVTVASDPDEDRV